MPWKFLIRVTAILAALMVAVILSLPLWLPWLASPIAARFGLTWEDHRREGYHSLHLEQISFHRENVKVTVDSLTFNQPLAWAWRVLGPGSTEENFAEGRGIFVEVTQREEPRPPRPDRERKSLSEIFDLVDQIMAEVTRWAPVLEVHDATVKVPGLEEAILVEQAKWNKGKLTTAAEVRWLEELFALEGEIRWPGEGDFGLYLHERERDAKAHLLAHRAANVWQAELVFDWLENQFTLETDLAEEGHMPSRIKLDSDDFEWPADLLQIPHYESLAGAISFLYEEEQWSGQSTLSLRGSGERFPPLNLELAARGDLEVIELEKLSFFAPWLVLHLSSPLTLTTAGDFVDPQTNLSGLARLEAVPWLDMEGEINLSIALDTARDPDDLEFRVQWQSENLRWEELALGTFSGNLKGENRAGTWAELAQPENLSVEGTMHLEDLLFEGLSLANAAVAGTLNWPAAEIEDLSAASTSGSSLSLAGGLNWEEWSAKDLRGNFVLQAEEVQEWLPEGVHFSPLEGSFQADGKWPDLRHKMALQAEQVTVPELKSAELQWSSEGTGMDLQKWSLLWAGKEAEVTLAGELTQTLSPWKLALNLEEFSLADQEAGSTLALSDSARITVEERNQSEIPAITIENLNLAQSGEQGEGTLSLQGNVAWPQSGDLKLRAENISPFLANALLHTPLPDPGVFTFPQNDLQVRWEYGPLEFDWQKTLTTRLPDAPPLNSRWAITAGEEGIRLNQWEIIDQDEELIMAEGLFPIRFYPSRVPDDFFEIDFSAPLRWKAESSGEASFWKELVNLSEIQLENPRVKTDISGTLRNPEGRLRVAFDTFRYVPSGEGQEDRQQFPPMNEFIAEFAFTRQLAEIERFRFTSEGQEVLLSGKLPLGDQQWEALLTTGEFPDWRRLEAALEIPEAEIAAFSTYLPDIISPQGTVSGQIRLQPGGQPEGRLSLRGAATRPMLPLGGLSEISGDLLLENRKVRLENLGGRLGGQRIRIDGQLDYEEDRNWSYTATLQGKNLPIVRQPGMILRTDLDLALNGTTRRDETTVISGDVNLRDSFFLQEVRFQAPGSVTTPAMRPPFFSVDIDPVGDWELDLNITGKEFITVRSAVFNGVVNADLRLQSTLREPQAIGQIDVARGTIRFPFASLGVQEAVVRLAEENPFVPEIFAQAQGQVFGYDITLDLTGTSLEPIIEFSSTPPLSSEEILLMITAGEVPEREIVFTGQQRAGRLAMFLGQNLLYELTGQDDAGERLQIESGNNISRQGRETFIIEYLLTDRFSAVGEYDEYDAVNIGLKWNILSR
ncbi:MAG: translocation/assembly module TamB [Opitutales bacterium]|nr:translocation/assembly module TamB [Opitutales bacterium]